MDLVPHTLKQISLTINTPRSPTTWSLSLHRHLNVIHPLSLMRYCPVASFGRHVCHVATSRGSHALLHMTLSHSHLLVIPTCFSFSPLIFHIHPLLLMLEWWNPERPQGTSDSRRQWCQVVVDGKMRHLQTGIGMFYTRKETSWDLWHC